MVLSLNFPKYLIISILLVLLNLVSWPAWFFYLIFGGLFLILNSLVLGHWLFIKNSWICKFLYGLLFLLIIASLIGSLSFYIWFLNDLVFVTTIILIPLLLSFIVKKYPLIFELNFNLKNLRFKTSILTFCYLVLLALLGYLVVKSGTPESLRSPWQVLPSQFFLIYFLASFILLAIVRFSKSTAALFLIVIHSFLGFSIAWLVYQIGFDYDPFIHRTNVNLILENGTLLPKPFYYIGQYSLIIFIFKLLRISVESLDKVLVPLLAALYIPSTIFYAFRDNFKTSIRLVLMVSLAVLALPFANFISTTPQSLSNLLFYLTILLSLYYITHPKVSVWPLLLITLMTLSVHPLSGIPLVFFTLLLFIYQHRQRKFRLPKLLHQSVLWEVVILGSLALPTAFLINSLTLSELKVSLQTNWFQNILDSLGTVNLAFYYRQFISLTDLIYTYGYNLALIIVCLALIGFFFIVKNQQLKRYLVYPLAFIILLANFFLLKGMVSFFSLLSYEQIAYPQRILELALYVLAPFIIIALYLFFKKIFLQKNSIQLLILILLSLAMTANLYLSYPRVDKIVEDHGYSTSQTDLTTVNFIDDLQKDEPYLVLASQPVSAAAIDQLGFKHYYNEFFFYPVPTGGLLYRQYEDLAYAKQKTSDVIDTVRYLTGVKVIYFVVNDYWFDAEEIIESHKETSDKWFAIDGKNYIFKYWN